MKKTSKTTFKGNVIGPIHTGTGDINIEKYQSPEEKKLQDSTIVDFFDSNKTKRLIKDIAYKISTDNLQKTYVILKNFDEQEWNYTDEFSEIVKDLTAIISGINNEAFPEKTDISNILNPKLSLNNQIKVSIPIIPFLLSYEGAIQIDNMLKLKKIWNWFLTKFGIR